MRRWLEAVARRDQASTGPITDPLRVMVVDPEAASGIALGRAIDMDPEMALVGLSRDPRRVLADAGGCGPDVVAVRLAIEDERCRDVLSALAGYPTSPCVIVLGPAGRPDMTSRDAAALAIRIRAVADANRSGGWGGVVVVPPAISFAKDRLN